MLIVYVQPDMSHSQPSFFAQSLRNKDSRFRKDPGSLFAAADNIKKEQLQRNVNLSFIRGQKVSFVWQYIQHANLLKEGKVWDICKSE